MAREVLERRKKVLGDGHPDTITAGKLLHLIETSETSSEQQPREASSAEKQHFRKKVSGKLRRLRDAFGGHKPGPLQPCHDILADDEKRTLYAEIDFEIGCGKQFHKLNLPSPDEDARDISVSYMPWPSRNIRVGFDDSEKLQDRYWEAVEKMKLPKQESGRREYKWTTSFNGEEKTAPWTESTRPARYRNYSEYK
ncbi:hypothetical protein E5D57_003581 [Metarhizium anisopliae]|nr:hypothetical protein E5D57_003581 [Metarhizium anisopliae]